MDPVDGLGPGGHLIEVADHQSHGWCALSPRDRTQGTDLSCCGNLRESDRYGGLGWGVGCRCPVQHQLGLRRQLQAAGGGDSLVGAQPERIATRQLFLGGFPRFDDGVIGCGACRDLLRLPVVQGAGRQLIQVVGAGTW